MESKAAVTRLLELARLDPKYLEELESFRRTLVVMFTDIHGSTAYFEKHGDAAGLLLVHECNSVIRSTAEKHGGRVIKTIGDGSMVTFEDCGEAIAAAVEMQSTLSKVNSRRDPEEQVAIRVGLHYGSGIVKSNDVFGDVVNMASRVESVALPGQIVVSEQLNDKLSALGLRTTELGRFSLKGKAGEQLLFEVRWNEDTKSDDTAECGRPTPIQTAPEPVFKLQVLNKDGAAGAEYPLDSELTVGRTEGDIQFREDAKVSPLHARIALESGLVFVDDISNGGESVFLRLSAGYTLQDGDIIIMGTDAFRFHEDRAAMSAAAMVGATVADLNGVISGAIAQFIQISPAAKAGKSYPLMTETVQFGRAKGTYTFPENKLMSRLHAKVLQRGEDFVIEDGGSRNGTFIKVRERTPVPVGSAILVGSCLLKLIQCA